MFIWSNILRGRGEAFSFHFRAGRRNLCLQTDQSKKWHWSNWNINDHALWLWWEVLQCIYKIIIYDNLCCCTHAFLFGMIAYLIYTLSERWLVDTKDWNNLFLSILHTDCLGITTLAYEPTQNKLLMKPGAVYTTLHYPSPCFMLNDENILDIKYEKTNALKKAKMQR